MRKNSIYVGAALAGAALVAGQPSTSHASSHREAPAIADDPAADNTDTWAWVSSGTHDKLYVVASYIPLEEPAGGPNFHKFSDDVLYEIHISRGDSLNEEVTYQLRFKTSPISRVDPADQMAPLGGGKEFFAQLSGQTQTYNVLKVNRDGSFMQIANNVPVAPVNIGPRTDVVTRGAGAVYDDAYAATFIRGMGGEARPEGRVWAGPRDDGFYVDLGGVFDLANLRAKGDAQDGVAGYNCHTIALEIPTTLLTANGQLPGNTAGEETTLGVWASASRKKFTVRRNMREHPDVHYGPWVQVSRLGLPLINEAVIGLQDKDVFNATHPRTDAMLYGAYFLNPVVVRDAEAVGIYMALGADPTPFKYNRTDILDIISLNGPDRSFTKIGDVLRVDMATDSSFPNGRPIPHPTAPDQEQADVTDVLLSVILARGMVNVKDNVDYNDKRFLTQFPWLALPWRGYDEGHGIPTP